MMFLVLLVLFGFAGAANFSDYRCFCYCKSNNAKIKKVTLEANHCTCTNPDVIPNPDPQGLCHNFCDCQKQTRNTAIIKTVITGTIVVLLGSMASLIYMIIVRPCRDNKSRPSLDIGPVLDGADWSDMDELIMEDALENGVEIIQNRKRSSVSESLPICNGESSSGGAPTTSQRRRSVVDHLEGAQKAWIRRLSEQQDNVYHSKKLLN